MTDPRPVLAVLVTCHNRRPLTVACIDALAAAVDPARADLRLFLVDDGSTDGTAEAVRAIRPDATIIRGSGSLYWNGGMRVAWQAALGIKPDFYVWLNDDLVLRPGSIDQLIGLWFAKRADAGDRLLVVGRVVSPTNGRTTYGGYMRAGKWSRLRFRRRAVGDSDTYDTMNGNCVVIPARAVSEVGVNSLDYIHGYGDIDYGLRARKAGYRIFEYPEPVGYQERNHAYEANHSRIDLSNWRFILFDPKGVSLKEWFAFCRSHGGAMWLGNFVYRYLKLIKNGA